MHRITLLLTVLLLTLGAMAQQKASKAERAEWMKEMQQYKNEFMARKLKLTDEQKTKFIPMLNRMDSELRKVGEQTRRLSKEVSAKGEKATDLEKEKAAEAQFECKMKEGQIEMKYYDQFKKVLTTDQMLKFKEAERDFMKNLMKKHREQRKKTSDNPKGKHQGKK